MTVDRCLAVGEYVAVCDTQAEGVMPGRHDQSARDGNTTAIGAGISGLSRYVSVNSDAGGNAR